MRVLLLTPVYPRAESPAEGVFIEQGARALRAAGAEVTVAVAKPWLPRGAARRSSRYRALASLPARERRDGLEILYARYLHLPRYRLPAATAASCARAIRAALAGHGGFDVVHAHGAWPVGMAAPGVAATLAAPFAVTLHIEDDERLARSRAYAAMLERAAAVAVVGSPLARFLERLGHRREPVRVPNGIDLAAIEAVATAATAEPAGNWGHVVSVSNLWPLKGIDGTLRALALLDRRQQAWERYTIVGDGPERGRLEELTRELGLDGRVDFAGRQAHRQALERVAAADVFCLPSWQESFGVAHLEAMALGKPVIGCRGQGVEDFVDDGVEGLLVEPRDASSLADALARLLADEPWARRLGSAAAARARALTWERNAERTLELYRAIRAREKPE